MVLRGAAALLLTVCLRLATLDAACLNSLFCYDDLYLNRGSFVMLYSNLEKRSAVTCAVVCLQRWPETSIVMAKLVDVNQRLGCGCGDDTALSNHSGTVHDYYDCYVCPDGDNQKCGSERTTSVYRVEHNSELCARVHFTLPEVINYTTTTITAPELPSFTTPANGTLMLPSTNTTHNTTTRLHRVITHSGPPQLVYTGCYNENHINESLVMTMLVERPGANITHCARTCGLAHPSADLYLVKLLKLDRLYCGCGVTLALGKDAEEGNCDLYCQDDFKQSCGGWVSVSAYTRRTNGGGGHVASYTSCTPLMTLLFLLLVM
ncbi:uncharacterized protein LOC121868187 [Homarus americanus]|uniref:uncharacterized protein LOC121868187 n=1 Tax=Homarus americanus TaxID=6706 RepID=UPI001C48CCC0|nr:uncharacterized protein LOC121868187 [Homarus americanus]